MFATITLKHQKVDKLLKKQHLQSRFVTMLKIDLNSRGGFHHGHIIDYCDMFMLAFI